jgi:uncharacterized protein (DUF488 family)
MLKIYGVGHGTRPIEEFVEVLRSAGVKMLADVRSVPGSHRHPQFGKSALASSLAATGIEYVHLSGLGGRRDPSPGSQHVALRIDAFRGYADHMASDEFAADYARLDALARAKATAFMCAETSWSQCHRRILADRLTVDGWDIVHLLAPENSESHRIWDVARVVEGGLVYDGGAIPLGS